MHGISQLLLAMLISMSPMENKTGIPYIILQQEGDLNLNYALAICLCCCLANIIAIPIAFFFFDKINHRLSRYPKYKRFSVRFTVKTKIKAKPFVEKYGFWGLFAFVAIPLPMTGAYIGSLAAYIFDINPKKAFLPLALGVVLAGVIVTLVYSSAKLGFNQFFNLL